MMHVATLVAPVVPTTHHPALRPTQPVLCPSRQQGTQRCAQLHAHLTDGAQSTRAPLQPSPRDDSPKAAAILATHRQPFYTSQPQQEQQQGSQPLQSNTHASRQQGSAAGQVPQRTHRRGWGDRGTAGPSNISKESAELIQDLIAQVCDNSSQVPVENHHNHSNREWANRGQRRQVPGEVLEELASRVEAVLAASAPPLRLSPGSRTSSPQQAVTTDTTQPAPGRIATPQEWTQLLRVLKAAEVQVGGYWLRNVLCFRELQQRCICSTIYWAHPKCKCL
jgi:hypothetical protein